MATGSRMLSGCVGEAAYRRHHRRSGKCAPIAAMILAAFLESIAVTITLAMSQSIRPVNITTAAKTR
jgi:hypothetical protein